MSSEPSEQNPNNKFKDQTPIESPVEATIIETPDSVIENAHTPYSDQQFGAAADQLSYLHPTSLIFDVIAHGKTYLVPAAFGLWGAAKGDLTLLIMSAIIFIPALLTSVFRYFTYRYSIQGDQLVVTQGLIFRSTRTVPVSRIQNIDFVQNPLHQILRVAEVKVETASGTKPEATLRVLSMEKMESLRAAVFGQQANLQPDVLQQAIGSNIASDGSALSPLAPDAQIDTPVSPYNSHAADDTHAADATTSLLQIPLAWLFKAGLASNRGLIMVGVLFGAYIQFGDRDLRFEIDWFRDLIPEKSSTLMIVALSAGALIGALLLLRLFGIGWYILRFYGYQLTQRVDDLRISCGLLTKVSATVPRQRIQFISIHRSLIMRMMGLASISIETAGGAGQEGEDATETVSKRWFVPVIPESSVPELLASLRPGLTWNESSLDFQPLANRVGTRLARKAIVQAVLICGAGLLITRPWGWAIGVAALPLLLIWANKKSKAMRYARTENGVVYRSGVLNRKTSMTFFEKIQTLRVDQSPFDRRWKMAQLCVDTAAAGPADHRIEIPYLDEHFAHQELQLLRIKTGQEQPVFG